MNKTILTFILSALLLFNLKTAAFELNDTTIIRLNELQVDGFHGRQFTGTTKVLQAFSSAEIARTPAQSMDAFLKSIPGVDVRQRSIGGTQADISIRGGSFDQVLVLLNGVNITDQQTGHHNLNIPVELSEISRIEVLQGSAARKYGSQAFSGAINIITDPKSKNKLDVALTGGSFDTYSQKLTVGAGKDKITHFTTFSHQASEGYRENTDYDIYNLFSQTNFESANTGTFDFQAGYQHKSFGANSFYTQLYPNQFEHTQTFFSSLNWQRQWQELYLSATAHYRKHYDRFELFRDFEGAASWYLDHNYHMTDVAGVSADMEYLSKLGKIAAGASLRYDHIFSTVLGELIVDETKRPANPFEKNQDKYFSRNAHRLINTAYLDFSRALNSIYFSAGTSISHSQDFGFKHHWGADISYLPLHHLTLYTSVNSASRLPTFTDLYYQNATHISNPGLKPETSLTAEAGVKYDLQSLKLSAGGFYRMGNNIIDWVRYPGQDKWESMNLTSLNTSGMNVSAEYVFRNLWLKNISLAYSYIHSDKEASGYDSKYALDYLRHQLILRLHHQLVKNLTVSWNAGYNDRAGSYTDFDSGELTAYKPYILAGCRVTWENRSFMVYADVNNLLNENYVDYGGLPQPGRYGMVGVRWKLK